jgi:NadR type nicotinamide-nucleotide adenylyltransferase
MYRIAVVGPESTGKSELSKKLAAHYQSPWVDEYARHYVEQLNRHYTFDDICTIARKQIEDELVYEKEHAEPYVFFDTDLIITKVWFDYCFQKIPDFVNERLKTGFFDLYLLCEPDLPWQSDPVREHGSDRDYFFTRYKSEIIQLGKSYVCIRGLGNDRLSNAIKQIDNYFNNKCKNT